MNRDTFSYKEFIHVPASYTPVYAWCWAMNPDPESTIKDLDEFVRLGIRRLYVIALTKSFRPASYPTTLELEYLGPAFMEQYTWAVEQAKKRGIQVWLYDEAGWPSGGADGRVVKAHPEYARTKPRIIEQEYNAGEQYVKGEERAAFIEDQILVEDGYVFDKRTRVTKYIRYKEIYDVKMRSDFCDISSKEAVECFLQFTHEKYKAQVGTEFTKSIEAVFTDEPTMPSPMPFSEEMEVGFEKACGESILPYLPVVTGRRAPESENEKKTVIAWYDYCSRVFCESYMQTCHKWCKDNGLLFTGHMDIDHVGEGSVKGGNYNIMRALRYFDIPGVDAIWRQIYPCEKKELNPWTVFGENGFYPRFASSAAAQSGNTRALTESFSVYGNGLTFEQMRYILTFQAIRGINVFNMMLLPYGNPNGFQRIGQMPFFREQYACYEDLAVFNQYAERVSYITSLGVHLADTALYMPIKDFYVEPDRVWEFDRFGKNMEQHQIPFDICDDDVIENADPLQIQKGRICMGNASYSRIVISDCRYMPEAVKRMLKLFCENGGTLITTQEAVQKQFPKAIVCADIENVIPPAVRIAGENQKIRVMKRQCQNAEIECINNESFSTAKVQVALREDAYLINLTEGIIYKAAAQDGLYPLELAGGEMAAILYTDAEVMEELPLTYVNEMHLTDFNIRKTKQFVIDETTSYSRLLEEKAVPIELGEWSSYTNPSFSGSCIYTTRFSLAEAGESVLLDLGEVHYTCEVFINGQSLGKKVMAPYTYRIAREKLQRENLLEIRVSNTAANAYVYTTAFDQYEKWQLTPYYDTIQLEHQDSLPSGLYGPVRIFY